MHKILVGEKLGLGFEGGVGGEGIEREEEGGEETLVGIGTLLTKGNYFCRKEEKEEKTGVEKEGGGEEGEKEYGGRREEKGRSRNRRRKKGEKRREGKSRKRRRGGLLWRRFLLFCDIFFQGR